MSHGGPIIIQLVWICCVGTRKNKKAMNPQKKKELLVASLLLVAMPFVISSFLLLVVRPGIVFQGSHRFTQRTHVYTFHGDLCIQNSSSHVLTLAHMGKNNKDGSCSWVQRPNQMAPSRGLACPGNPRSFLSSSTRAHGGTRTHGVPLGAAESGGHNPAQLASSVRCVSAPHDINIQTRLMGLPYMPIN